MEDILQTQGFLGFGSNIGDRVVNINKAIELTAEKCFIQKVSAIYETQSLLKDDQTNYFNLICSIRTQLSPHELLKFLQNIENLMGRVRNVKRWGERLIDIDIIHLDSVILNDKDLTIPHESMLDRSFVLYPLQEIAPNYIHPLTGEHISKIIEKLDYDYKIKIVQIV